ncbi:MAG: ATP-dependent DNA helicase [Janthinobacterium lividum]
MNAPTLPGSVTPPLEPAAGVPTGAAAAVAGARPNSFAGPPLDPARAAELEQVFAAGGSLARRVPGFHSRASQQQMAQAVAAAMQAAGRAPDAENAFTATPERASDNTLIVEAGTGTGKTFAYLVPAMLWGGKVIISTGTKHLQDQLYNRDLPTVRDALGAPVSAAMLKGRANYLCHYYLERSAEGARMASRQDAAHLREIVRFAKITRTGDKAELATVPENAAAWTMVTSTRENCLGQECPHYQDCFVMQARRAAQQADIVVVNHHLFFADIMLRDTGMAELLPSANTIIFDEAHQLPDTATLFFGETVSTGQLLELARDMLAEGLLHAREAVDWLSLHGSLERTTRDLRLVFPQEGLKLASAQLGDDHPLFDALDALSEQLEAVRAALASQAERAESLAACLRRVHELADSLTRWREAKPLEVPAPSAGAIPAAAPAADRYKDKAAPASKGAELGAAPQTVRWIEVFSHAVQLHQTPLSIAPIFAKQRAGAPRAWIFTSATLAVKSDFTHYAAQMGLDASRSMTLPSPFDYPRQALLYVPRNLPAPASPAFVEAAFRAALPLIEASGGRAFILCTTLRSVERMAALLRETIAEKGWSYPLLVQGQVSRTELLERFRTAGNAILVGSQSFWEGVDVRGDALSLVVIDKLPFAPPDDPVLAARLDALNRQGLSPFAVHQVPQAVISLKQGAGRLIRAETDRGVLMICDARIVEKPYGRRMWQSLPPFTRTRDEAFATAFLQQKQMDEQQDDAS